MGSISKFIVEISGPEPDRRCMIARLEAAFVGRSEDGDVIVRAAIAGAEAAEIDATPHFWLRPVDGQVFQETGDHSNCEGESRNTPPVRYFAEISEQFPTLMINIKSVTDFMLIERWIIAEGMAKLIDAVEDPIVEPEIWFVKDGLQLQPLPHWIDEFYRLGK